MPVPFSSVSALQEMSGSRTVLPLPLPKQANQHAWQSEVVLSAILAKQKQSQLRLIRQPVRYHSLFTENNASLHDAALALNVLLWWEGRSDVQEYIPKRVNKTVANLITRGKKIYNVFKNTPETSLFRSIFFEQKSRVRWS